MSPTAKPDDEKPGFFETRTGQIVAYVGLVLCALYMVSLFAGCDGPSAGSEWAGPLVLGCSILGLCLRPVRQAEPTGRRRARAARVGGMAALLAASAPSASCGGSGQAQRAEPSPAAQPAKPCDALCLCHPEARAFCCSAQQRDAMEEYRRAGGAYCPPPQTEASR